MTRAEELLLYGYLPGRAAEARADLRRALRPRQLRFHWRTERNPGRLAFLRVIAGLDLASTVTYQHPVRRRKQEQARVRCLWEAGRSTRCGSANPARQSGQI